MSHDYLPPRDPEFNDWFTAFQLYTAAHAAELGLTPAQALEIQTAKASGLQQQHHGPEHGHGGQGPEGQPQEGGGDLHPALGGIHPEPPGDDRRPSGGSWASR